MNRRLPDLVTEISAYKRGVADYKSQCSFKDCPFDSGMASYKRWHDGFLAARTNDRLGLIFLKYKVPLFPTTALK